jgi:GTP cyclohydrolase I
LLLSESDAKKQALVMQEKYNEWFEFYACPYCGGFHVGHANKKKVEGLGRRIKRLVQFYQSRPRIFMRWLRAE